MAERHYVILEDRGLVTVGGPDRAAFLQGIVSNDVTRVAPDHAIWAALLTPQGKYLHDFFIAEIGAQFYLDCEAGRLMDLGRRLSRYKLRARVDLGIGQDFLVAALPGADARAAMGLPEELGAARGIAGGVVFVDPRLAAVGARAVLPRKSAETVLRDHGFVPVERDAYDRLRLSLGLSDGSRDLVVEKSILLESNFEELHGVDWKKGCYMGQELTARTKYRGLVKKRLMPVEIEGEAPPPGTPIMLGEKEVGEMRSSLDGRGLALLRLEPMEQVARGKGELRAGGARIVPHKPDWASY